MKTTKTKNLLLGIAIGIGTSFAAVAQNVPNYVPTNGLVGWWPFNGNANDESGNNNNGTVNGATLTSDRFGNANKAYSFDGVDDYVLNNSNTGLGLNSRTIDFWMKTTGASLNPQVLIDEGGSICGSGFAIVNLNPSNFLRFDNSCSYKDMTSSFGLNQWINVVIVFDNSISNGLSGVKFYINGNLIINYSTLNGANLNINSGNSFPLTFAKSRLENNYFFSGELDDIGIWNRALTQQEITDLYNANICYQTVTVTDTLIINTNTVSFNPITYQNTIKIFPNPTSDHITINYGNFATLNGYQLKIINSLGQQMFQTAINQQSSYINLSNWTGNGIYFVQIIDPQGNIIDIRKIVLQ